MTRRARGRLGVLIGLSWPREVVIVARPAPPIGKDLPIMGVVTVCTEDCRGSGPQITVA